MNPDTLATVLTADSTGELKYTRTIADLPGPKGLPYVGNALQAAGRQLHLTLAKWIREFGPIFRLNVFGRTLVVVSDQASVNSLLRDRPEGFRRMRNLKVAMGELNIKGVITAEGDEWRKQRKLVMGGLSVEVVRNFFPTMVAKTERTLHRWQAMAAQGREIDLRRELKALALEMVVGIAMGFDIDAVNDEGHPLQRHIDNLFLRLGARTVAWFPYWRYVKLPVDHAADKSSAEVERAVASYIHEARERLRQQSKAQQKPANMLEAMIIAAEDPDSNFTDQDLISNAMLSVIGGEDTTSNTIAWMVHLLAQNPGVAARLRAEVDGVLGPSPVAGDWEWMKQFPYLEAAHSETQRLRAVAPYIGLASNADCVVNDTFIPKDTAVLVSTIGEGLHETQFPQNETFNPERWLFEHKPHPDEDPARKLFPFGGGSRLCPGRFLALTEIKMVISMLVRNFEFELVDGAPPPEQVMNFFMAPTSLPVRLIPRG